MFHERLKQQDQAFSTWYHKTKSLVWSGAVCSQCNNENKKGHLEKKQHGLFWITQHGMCMFPGCYFFVGSADSNRGLDAPHHHPKFDFDETALTHAAALMAAAAVDLLVDAGKWHNDSMKVIVTGRRFLCSAFFNDILLVNLCWNTGW